jgi:hypothetical protein
MENQNIGYFGYWVKSDLWALTKLAQNWDTHIFFEKLWVSRLFSSLPQRGERKGL